MKPTEKRFLNRKETFELCTASILQIQKLYKNKVLSINTDIEAKMLLMELISNGYYALDKTSLDIESFRFEQNRENYFLHENARSIKRLHGLSYRKNIYNVRYSLVKKILLILNSSSCIINTANASAACIPDIYINILCKDCFSIFDNPNTAKSFDKLICEKCKETLVLYKKDKTKKKFCSVCLQNRILSAYNLLCYDVCNTYKIKKLQKEYFHFFFSLISILAYKLEDIKHGWAYLE